MTGYMVVKKLNKSGRYISSIDEAGEVWADETNPKGLYKMVIEPIEGVIEYAKLDKGYMVMGEGYFVTGNEQEIKEHINRYHSEPLGKVNHKLNNWLATA